MKRIIKNLVLLIILIISMISLISTIKYVNKNINGEDKYDNSLELDSENLTPDDEFFEEIIEFEEEPIYVEPDDDILSNEKERKPYEDIYQELGIREFKNTLNLPLRSYYIIITILSIIVSISLIYLILSLFNKYSFMEVLKSRLRLITLIIGIILLSLLLSYYFHHFIVMKSDMYEYEKLISSLATNNIDTLENYLIDEEGNKRNSSIDISKKHTSDNIEINNLRIVTDSENKDLAIINFDITNKSMDNYESLVLELEFIDNDNKVNEIIVLVGSLSSNDTRSIESYTYLKIIDSNDFKFSLRYDNQEPND